MTDTTTYKPELMPRRGEYTAWGLALLSVLGLVFLQIAGYSSWIANFFVGFLFFAALSISLGNWMDRQTVLQLGDKGIAFTNGLRKVSLGWNEIQEIRVMPNQNGDSVHIVGGQSHFQFKTLGEVRYAGEVKARTGFMDGDKIFNIILHRTGMKRIEESAFTRYIRP